MYKPDEKRAEGPFAREPTTLLSSPLRELHASAAANGVTYQTLSSLSLLTLSPRMSVLSEFNMP
jgi:hypothetical protein